MFFKKNKDEKVKLVFLLRLGKANILCAAECVHLGPSCSAVAAQR